MTGISCRTEQLLSSELGRVDDTRENTWASSSKQQYGCGARATRLAHQTRPVPRSGRVARRAASESVTHPSARPRLDSSLALWRRDGEDEIPYALRAPSHPTPPSKTPEQLLLGRSSWPERSIARMLPRTATTRVASTTPPVVSPPAPLSHHISLGWIALWETGTFARGPQNSSSTSRWSRRFPNLRSR